VRRGISGPPASRGPRRHLKAVKSRRTIAPNATDKKLARIPS
jgi:hypothetical protein